VGCFPTVNPTGRPLITSFLQISMILFIEINLLYLFTV
jgi:hypothetical protein